MAETEPSLLRTTQDAVVTLTLNRPHVLNALDTSLAAALRRAFDEIEVQVCDGSVRAVILTGAGRGFCAGADLADPQMSTSDGSPAADLGDYLRRNYHALVEQMRWLPAPIITAVNGSAAGAGMSLALAGDIVIAGESASFLQAFSRIGLIPDAGSTYFLPRMVGESRARALAILAGKISAGQAQEIGLVWQVVPDEELQQTVHAMAARLATMPTRAYGFIKEAMNQSLQNDLTAQLEVEARLQSLAGQTDDFREGVAAFLAKRPPVFKGR